MKIIRMPKRGLTVLFLKIFIVIAVLFCIFKIVEFAYDFSGFDDVEYENSAHVLEVFEKNKGDFDLMVDVLEETNINRILFDDYMDNPKPLMPCPGDALKNPKYQIRRKGLLEKEDYGEICNFFKKYGPVRIDGTVEFRFDFKIKDGIVYLCYIPTDISDIVLDTLEQYNETIIPLNENWYFAY